MVACRTGLQDVAAAVVESARYLHEQPGSVAFLRPCQADEGVPVPAHRVVPGAALQLPGIVKDQLALLGITTSPMTLHAPDGGDLVPDLPFEVVVLIPAAAGTAVRRDLLAPSENGTNEETPSARISRRGSNDIGYPSSARCG